MGRSSRERMEMNRKRIVSEADAALRSGGVAAIGVADVMARAGMTQGGFYKHFTSKDALIVEACLSMFELTTQTWQDVSNSADPTDCRSALERLVELYLGDRRSTNCCPMVALGQDVASPLANNDLIAAYRSGVKQLFDIFQDIVRTNQSSTLPQDQPILAFAAMIGANMLSRATGMAEWANGVEKALSWKSTREL